MLDNFRFHIVCFHQQWVAQQFGRSGLVQTGYWKNIVTFRGQSDYPYETYQDLSEYPDIPTLFQENTVLAFHMENIARPGDDFTEQDVERYKEKLIEGCRARDINIKCDTELKIPEASSQIISIKEDEKPFWLNLHFYMLSILFSLNGILKIKFQLLSRPRSLLIKKMMFSDPSKVPEYNLQGTGTIPNIRQGEPDTILIISHVDHSIMPQMKIGAGGISKQQNIIDLKSAQPISYPTN